MLNNLSVINLRTLRPRLNDITFIFLPQPANMLSFSHQENMLHKTFFSTSINKNVFFFYFDKKHFRTNLLGEQCFTVYPSPKHVEDTPLGPIDRRCPPSPTSNQNFKKADDEEDCSGKINGW